MANLVAAPVAVVQATSKPVSDCQHLSRQLLCRLVFVYTTLLHGLSSQDDLWLVRHCVCSIGPVATWLCDEIGYLASVLLCLSPGPTVVQQTCL
jgi:hypothetical protein